MRLGVNVPNFGPGARPEMLRQWAQTVEGLGFDLLMVSDHVVITPDVASQYPAPFYEPFTTLSWLAGVTSRVRLGTTVMLAPYRHPLLVARMAANLHQLSGERLVLGVGVGWARQEFAALDVPFGERGRRTDELLRVVRKAWADTDDYGPGRIPLWIGGNGEAGLRRTVSYGDAWHPLRLSLVELRAGLDRLRALATGRDLPSFAPRIRLQLTSSLVEGADRPAGVGTIDQVLADLAELRTLGAETVVFDPFDSDPEDLCRPEIYWQDLATVMAHVKEDL